MIKKSIALALSLAASGLTLAGAGDHVSATDPYVRQAPPSAAATGAFMTLKNSGDTDVRLLRVSNPASRLTELHAHTHEDGVMKMRQVPSIEIKAKSEAVLRPGGLHIMLIDLKAPLREGETIPFTLTFDDGSSMQVDARIMRPSMGQMPAGK